jgi:hypothetical protein
MNDHNHDDVYAPKTHKHDGVYSDINHEHDYSNIFAPKTHGHEGFLTFWIGTQDQFDAITTKDPNRLYIITD